MNLRERQKQITREELAQTAMRLVLERGFDQVRIADIATAAGVAERTFRNYFSSKEEAIVAVAIERASNAGQALRQRPTGEPLSAAIAEAVLEQYQAAAQPSSTGTLWRNRRQLIMSVPSLQAEYLRATQAMERTMAEAIAERTGADLDRDLEPWVLAAAVSAAERRAVFFWLTRAVDRPLPDLLRQALAQVLPA
ncbi:TetR family transcriptional regulator [Nonomuraea sp. CA-141351]|uniref:acyl-CoA-like ligand-binding transcription factor n=1 Tax=Nonomuraea sp. CA-141351 TaxID=3239996 RepID=UPI003D8DC5FA